MQTKDALDRFESASALLPEELRRLLRGLPEDARIGAEEIRLRAGRPLSVVCRGQEREIEPVTEVSSAQLRRVLEIATRASVHIAEEQIKKGYITSRDGHRIGVCGQASAVEGGYAVREPSSLCVRVSRECPGIAEPLIPQLMEKGKFVSTVIVSPPGFGKTTLLRDLVRRLSLGDYVNEGLRICLIDERNEVSAMSGGQPSMDVGPRTDVISGCPKAQAVISALRRTGQQLSPHWRGTTDCRPVRR